MPELTDLEARLRSIGPVVVAFSGGADSAFLAWVAHRTLGPDRCVAATAVSPSLAGDERADCAALAAEWGLDWREVSTTWPTTATAAPGARRRSWTCSARWPKPPAPPWCSV